MDAYNQLEGKDVLAGRPAKLPFTLSRIRYIGI